MDFFLTDDQVEDRLRDEENILSPSIHESLDLVDSLPAKDGGDNAVDDHHEDEGGEDGHVTVAGLAPKSSSPESSPSESDVFTRLKLAKILNDATPGRKKNIRNRTMEENGSIGLSTKLLGSRNTEEMLGVDPGQQGNIQHGYTGSVDRVNKKNYKEDLLDEIYRQGGVVTNLAFSRLLKSLHLLDNNKIEEVSDPVKLLSVARGLSGIVKDMTPKESDVREQSVHFHVYRPEQNQDSDYDTIEVKKNEYESIEA